MTGPTRIPLPPEINEPFEVFINGVPQKRGSDFDVHERTLVFPRSLDQSGKLGRMRRLFLVFAGSYRNHETVDVAYELEGRRIVATGIESRRD